MLYFQNLALELIEVILEHIDVASLARALRTAKFLQYPSERRLYYRVNLWTSPTDPQRLEDCQAIFLNTVWENIRLADHVVELAIGGFRKEEGDDRINRVIGDSMKKMINLKKLAIFGYPYITHANLDSVPFSLTHLIISGDRIFDTDPETPLLSILRAHSKLVDLELDYPKLPSSLIEALNAEQKAISNETGIICPNIKRFDGYDEGLRLFLPLRTIESGTTMGSGAEYIADDDLAVVWLTPALVQSYQHLRVLEVWPDRTRTTSFLSAIAPYLTSLTHLRTRDSLSALGTTGHLLRSVGQMPALESVTLQHRGVAWRPTVETAQEVVQLVCTACPDIAEIFVEGGAKPTSILYYRYVKGEGLQSRLVSDEVASSTVWLHYMLG